MVGEMADFFVSWDVLVANWPRQREREIRTDDSIDETKCASGQGLYGSRQRSQGVFPTAVRPGGEDVQESGGLW